jgi:flagellar biosynthesis protein FliR
VDFDFFNWMMVFLRASAMLAVFPIFSAKNFPVQLRVALGGLMAALICSSVPSAQKAATDLWGLAGQMGTEIGGGLMFGFASGLVFFVLDIAGGIIGVEIGLSLPADLNPLSQGQSTAPSMVLYYLASMLWLSMDMHHWMLAAFEKTYVLLPMGGAHLSSVFLTNIVERTGQIFLVALELAAPLMAVSFIISLVFSLLGRAVPQMNVFQESFSVRPLVGMSVFGLTMELMAQHIMNYLRHLPEDMLQVAQMMGAVVK